MKITIATGPIFPVPAVRGGAVQRLWEGLAHEFVKRGHEVTIFAREFPGQAREETVDGIRYVRRGGYAQSTSIKRDLVQCLLYALKTARDVPAGDVVVTNDFWMPAVLPWLKPGAGKVVVNANRFPKKQYWLYPKCAAFAAVSQPVADGLKEQTPSAASRVAIVPNAVDEVFLRGRREQGAGSGEQEAGDGGRVAGLKDQEPETAAAVGDSASPALVGRGQTKRPKDDETTRRQDNGITGRPVRILYVGRIHPEKGVELLVQALKSMEHGVGLPARSAYRSERSGGHSEETRDRNRRPEGRRWVAAANKQVAGAWECVLVGPVAQGEGGGGEAFAAELKRQAEGLPLRFVTPVYDPAELAAIYDEADIFVYPSVADTGESFGIAPLEAMARGVVPVVSDLAVFREYLEPQVNGVVFDHRSGDAAANLAGALRHLIADKEKRRTLGAKARITAEGFSPSCIADKYLQLFEKVVSGT